MNYLKSSFPDNILEKLGIEKENMPEDFIATLHYIVYTSYSFCPPKERNTEDLRNSDIFMMYFKNNISYSAVAAHYGISTERVRQIIDKQIRKLCLPTRLNVLKLGLNKYYYLQKIEDNKKGFDRACKAFYDTIKTMDTDVIYYTEDELSNIPIEEMELTVRSFSCLKRAGINTVGDIIEKGETELKKVRNLGVKGYNEIVDTLIMRYGESEKNWRKSENDC